MKSIFIDCNDQLDTVWASVFAAGRSADRSSTRKPFARDDLPKVIGGYDIAIDDHSYMPTELVAQCPELKHIVFLGTGAGELHERR